MAENRWLNIGIIRLSRSGKALTILLHGQKYFVSLNQLFQMLEGNKSYCTIGVPEPEGLSPKERRKLKSEFYKATSHSPLRRRKSLLYEHYAFVSSLDGETKRRVLRKKG